MTEKEIENELRFIMRMLDGGLYPYRVPLSDFLKQHTTEEVAQPIYDRLIAELEKVAGPLERNNYQQASK